MALGPLLMMGASGIGIPTLNLEAWFDASDSSTISATGGSVTQWRDKSGNGHHVTPPGTAPSTGTRTHNSLNVVDFSGSPLTGSAFIYGLGSSTIFLVCVVDGTASIQNIVNDNGGVNEEFGLRASSSGTVMDYVHFDNPTTNFLLQSTSSPKDTWRMYTASYVDDTSADLRVGGTSEDSTTFGVLGMTPPSEFAIGGSYSAARYLDGAVAEILIYDGALSSTDVDTVESYLSSKWNV